ncbi:hypothetical protein QR680_007969 [Steinernema hermaphroditum]|uniref:AXH domain-containing protein n=1 Tax=Steinernema hermaphroditum TaxID=289476 RepID=A0AA39IEU3_9BILA|nr:hypothetical protein QR680_007969 [Steinernema hermaphroditum]
MLLSAQLAQAAANVAASTPSAFPAGPSTEHPQHSPQTPRVTPPVSAAFSAFGAAGPSQAGPSAAAMATQQLMQNYQQLLLSIMQQQQQQAQPRVPQYTPDPSTLTLQQQRNVADSTAMPPPPLPRRPIPSTISLPPPQPSTSQPRRTSPQHPQSLPSTSHQPQPHHIPPMPPMPRAALETIPELGTINMKPYYPTHFMRGTRIQLETGAVKNVEEMTQMDFHMSGAAAEGLDVELSKVIAIEKASEGSVQTAKVTLVAGDTKVRVTIQVFVEHPFFVIGYGWCSVNPTLTKARFGLDCQVLAVGHAAISLVKKEDKKRVQEHLNGASRRAAAAAAEGSSSTTGPRRPSLPSTYVQCDQSTREHRGIRYNAKRSPLQNQNLPKTVATTGSFPLAAIDRHPATKATSLRPTSRSRRAKKAYLRSERAPR